MNRIVRMYYLKNKHHEKWEQKWCHSTQLDWPKVMKVKCNYFKRKCLKLYLQCKNAQISLNTPRLTLLKLETINLENTSVKVPTHLLNKQFIVQRGCLLQSKYTINSKSRIPQGKNQLFAKFRFWKRFNTNRCHHFMT